MDMQVSLCPICLKPHSTAAASSPVLSLCPQCLEKSREIAQRRGAKVDLPGWGSSPSLPLHPRLACAPMVELDQGLGAIATAYLYEEERGHADDPVVVVDFGGDGPPVALVLLQDLNALLVRVEMLRSELLEASRESLSDFLQEEHF